MPFDIGDNYKYLNDLLSKNNGGYISPQEYTRYCNVSQQELWDDFMGRKTTPRITLGKNRLVDSRLLPFKKKVNAAFANEVLTKPAKCGYISAIYTRPSRIPVKPLDDDRQATVFNDPLCSPNEQDMYYVEGFTELTLLGEESLNITIEYYEKPTDVLYATTLVNGRPVYNQAGSVQFQWDKSEEQEITNRVLLKCGLSMRDTLEIQAANNNINQE